MDIVELTLKLVKIDSQNPFTGNPEKDNPNTPIEKEIAEFIYNYLNEIGLSPKKIGHENRPNVVVEIGKGKTIVFNGHMDTVPIGEGWKFNPFGEIKDGKIYGRGSLDMKGSLACFIKMLEELIKYESNLQNKVQVQFVVDEEVGACSEFGTKLLINKGYTGDFVIVGEPGIKRITIAHKGLLRFKITSLGESIHTGFKEWELGLKGKNAITEMMKLTDKLNKEIKKLEYPLDEYFPERKPIVFSFPTIIKGGVSINIVPNKCEAFGEIRYLPTVDIEEVEKIIKDLCNEFGAEYKCLLKIPAWKSQKTEMHEFIKEIIYKETGKLLEFEGCGAACDIWMFNKPGCIIGPEGKNPHAPNEYVEIESLEKIKNIYFKIATESYEYLEKNHNVLLN